ncbi:class I SAM-dependent methyltransferase [Actinoplanes sp. NPDC051513]|uniref:class I SAM-dependent methyltransferase n=1 Tax=Actinoplanes sp. NPDC051513 TaxID=3363908 RepID=UPI00379D229A
MAHQHMTEMLDLDAEVLHEFHREVISWAGALVPAKARIVDLGAGTGTGTLALARHLPEAEIIAVDVDDEMLAHLRHRAGGNDRIRTVQADLDGDWPELGPADLVWASASMHHLKDPDRTLGQIHDLLRPGGAILITELDAFPRFLHNEAEERGHAEIDRMRHEAGLHMHEDWGARLRKAGFELRGERRFDIELRPPLPANAVRYAEVTLHRMRDRLADRLSPDELAALTAPAPGELTIRATRTVWSGVKTS